MNKGDTEPRLAGLGNLSSAQLLNRVLVLTDKLSPQLRYGGVINNIVTVGQNLRLVVTRCHTVVPATPRWEVQPFPRTIELNIELSPMTLTDKGDLWCDTPSGRLWIVTGNSSEEMARVGLLPVPSD